MATLTKSRSAKLVLALLGCALGSISRPVVGQEQRVWFWFADCKSGALVLEVKLDGTLLQNYTIPICQANRDSVEGRAESRKISFPLQSSRAIKWSGYRAGSVITKAGHRLDVDLWQAGADPTDLLLGVSVSDSQSIYMNTIHIAYPEKPNSTVIAKGLVVTTRPASSAQ
jgi:hypothetical protein